MERNRIQCTLIGENLKIRTHPLTIMNLGVVIIYPRFKLKWADAADGKAECGVFSVCIESAFGACLLNYLSPLLVATLVAYT